MMLKRRVNFLHKHTFSYDIFWYFRYMSFLPKSILFQFGRRPVFYHLLGWGLFIFYEVFFVTILLGSGKSSNILYDYILPYAINIGLFYFHAHCTLRFSFKNSRNRYLLFAALLITELLLYLFLMNLNNIISTNKKSLFPLGVSKAELLPLLSQLWRGIYFVGFSTAYWLINRSVNYQKRINEMERMQVINMAHKNKLEKNLIEIENAYLQSQINPHLLFNTLNFIYNNVQQASTKASEAVILLAELMNHSLREQEDDGKTSLEKEVAQINNIIKINQIRFDNKLFLDVDIEGDFQNARIIPLGILVFIENLFKHGDLTDKNNPGKISLTYADNYLEVTTLNKKKNRSKIQSHGIGLQNIIKRLKTAYNDAFTLTIKNEETQFYVHLSINMK